MVLKRLTVPVNGHPLTHLTPPLRAAPLRRRAHNFPHSESGAAGAVRTRTSPSFRAELQERVQILVPVQNFLQCDSGARLVLVRVQNFPQTQDRAAGTVQILVPVQNCPDSWTGAVRILVRVLLFLRLVRKSAPGNASRGAARSR